MIFTFGAILLTTFLPWIVAITVVALLLKYWLKITPVRVWWVVLTLILGSFFAGLFVKPFATSAVLFIASFLAGFSFYKKYQISYWKGVVLAAAGYVVYGVVTVLFRGV